MHMLRKVRYVFPKYGHSWLGQAKPWVFIRFGALRRLLISHQGRTGRDAGSPTAEMGEERRQAGQSCGERGLRRRWTMGCTVFAPPGEEGHDEASQGAKAALEST